MRIVPTIVVVWCLLAAVPALGAQEKLSVRPDPANVVASRLMGNWQADTSLLRRFRSSPARMLNFRVSFRSDTSVASRVPSNMVAVILRALPNVRVYAAGIMTMENGDFPFILIDGNGNMNVVMFQPRGGDPMGDTESAIVQLGIADEPGNDLLLFGGDFNNSPFTPMRRVAPGTGAGR
jgi:hypothetical protein